MVANRKIPPPLSNIAPPKQRIKFLKKAAAISAEWKNYHEGQRKGGTLGAKA